MPLSVAIKKTRRARERKGEERGRGGGGGGGKRRYSVMNTIDQSDRFQQNIWRPCRVKSKRAVIMVVTLL